VAAAHEGFADGGWSTIGKLRLPLPLEVGGAIITYPPSVTTVGRRALIAAASATARESSQHGHHYTR
jgi:hypothetical protein